MDLPSATSTLASLGSYSLPLVSDLLPLLYFAGGIFLGVAIIGFSISVVKNLFHKD